MASTRVSIKWNGDEIVKALKSDQVGNEIGEAAAKITSRANSMATTDGAEYRTYVNEAKYCKVALSVCGNYPSRVDEYYHATLEKAAGVG